MLSPGFQSSPSATNPTPSVVLWITATSSMAARSNRPAAVRSCSTRLRQRFQSVAPLASESATQSLIAAAATSGSGATAAWSRYAQRVAEGIPARIVAAQSAWIADSNISSLTTVSDVSRHL